jgi:ribosomal protein S18 acetylase RimI-like enzyme
MPKQVAPGRRSRGHARPEPAADEPNLRPFTDGDRKACQNIAGLSTDYAHALDDNADAIEVVEVDGRVVGFAYIQVWRWNRVAWVGDVLIDEAHRDRGLGSALLLRMEQRARELGCDVVMDAPPSTHPVVSYYLKRGYRICGYNDRYYADSDNTTAIFLCKELT